ncbi:MAG TPA: DUF3180 domain-containing protein [Pseudonocardia sp.]|nr:DUF3180 domain-containing protein [Pseudonocardia sp.]
MTPTSIRQLVAVFLVFGVAGYVLTQASYAGLPPLPTLSGVPLLVLAGVEVAIGVQVKARIERKPGTLPIQPLMAARAVALAKASALAGAILGGLWGGFGCFVLIRSSQIEAARDDVPGAVIGVVCAAALAGAALWLEHCCRTPSDSDDTGPDTQR